MLATKKPVLVGTLFMTPPLCVPHDDGIKHSPVRPWQMLWGTVSWQTSSINFEESCAYVTPAVLLPFTFEERHAAASRTSCKACGPIAAYREHQIKMVSLVGPLLF